MRLFTSCHSKIARRLWKNFIIPNLDFLSVRWRRANRFAYVFYTTSSDYSCYALINAHRLVVDLRSDPKIDILILASHSSRIDRLCPNFSCPFPLDKVKIKIIPRSIVHRSQRLIIDNAYYSESFVKFEAFRLEYEKIVVMDSDGFVLKNIDHLFRTDLDGYHIAAARADYVSKVWISSILLVVEPSKRFYDFLQGFLTPRIVAQVAQFAEGAHFDMDVLNFALKTGNSTKRLSRFYALLDSHFLENDNNDNELDSTFYLHFTFKKPLEHLDTRPWPLEEIRVVDETSMATKNFGDKVYQPFWKAFDRYCRPLVQRIPTVPPDERSRAEIVYPDPGLVREFLNNMSDLIIVHM